MQHIGRLNCERIRRVAITIGVENGFLIKDPRHKENPWSDLVVNMKKAGCSNILRVRITQTVQPRSASLREVFTQNLVQEMADKKIQQCQETARLLLCIYINFMLYSNKKWKAQPLEHVPISRERCIALTRQAAFASDCVSRRDLPDLDPPFDWDKALEEDTYLDRIMKHTLKGFSIWRL